MRSPLLGALLGLLSLQAWAQTPLSYQDLQAKAKPSAMQWRTDALLAERHLQLQESRGLLREGPTLSASAGPRRSPGAPNTTDQGLEVDLPLFLSFRVRAELAASLGKAHPLLQESAKRECTLRLRMAYLDAWLAARLLALREADLSTVERWFHVAQARVDAGADPAFQVSLVEGEHLKALQDLDEARIQVARAWGVLVALADIPPSPMPLADPDMSPSPPRGDLLQNWQEGPLRKTLLAQTEVEERSLRLKEAQALSRWSLRSSYAQEGEENITRIGVAVRLPRPGEREAIHRNTEAQVRVLQGEARQALAELDARAQGVVLRLQKAPPVSTVPDFTAALAAVELRLREGRERPSEALPIRRQLLEAQMATLRRIHSQHLLIAELQALRAEVTP